MNDRQSKALEAGLNRVARELNIKDQREIVLNLARQWAIGYYYGGGAKQYRKITIGLRLVTERLIEMEDEAAKFEDL